MRDEVGKGLIVGAAAEEHAPLVERPVQRGAAEGFGVPDGLALPVVLPAAFGAATLLAADDHGLRIQAAHLARPPEDEPPQPQVGHTTVRAPVEAKMAPQALTAILCPADIGTT